MVGEATLVIVGTSAPEVDETNDHAPDPTVGVLAAIVTETEVEFPQVAWSIPAFEVVGTV